MADRTYTVKLRGGDIKITSRDLETFRQLYIGASELSSRMSELLWLDVYVLDGNFGVSPHDILGAIFNVEQGEPPTGIKPATQFNHPPLKGLWHKHFFSAHFVVQNIILGLGAKGLEKLVAEVMDPKESPVVTPEMIRELAHRVTHDPLEAREASKKLTGEWIVFARHDGKSYYLCCNTHGAGDQFIYDRIMEHCVREFPELPNWLKEV